MNRFSLGGHLFKKTPFVQLLFNQNNGRTQRKKKVLGKTFLEQKQSIEIDHCISKLFTNKLSTTLFRTEIHLHELHIK